MHKAALVTATIWDDSAISSAARMLVAEPRSSMLAIVVWDYVTHGPKGTEQTPGASSTSERSRHTVIEESPVELRVPWRRVIPDKVVFIRSCVTLVRKIICREWETRWTGRQSRLGVPCPVPDLEFCGEMFRVADARDVTASLRRFIENRIEAHQVINTCDVVA